MDKIDEFLRNFSIYSAWAILLFGWLLHFFRKFDLKYQPILWLLLASTLCDLLGKYLKYEYANNMPAFHLYSLLHGISLVWFFSLNIRNRNAVLQIGGTYLVLYILNSLFYENIFTYNAIAKVTQNVFFIGMSFWYFFDVYKFETNLDLQSFGIFWIVVGILIYHSGALFTSLFSAKILSMEDGSLFAQWILHNVSAIIKNILFFIGLWMGRTRLQTK